MGSMLERHSGRLAKWLVWLRVGFACLFRLRGSFHRSKLLTNVKLLCSSLPLHQQSQGLGYHL